MYKSNQKPIALFSIEIFETLKFYEKKVNSSSENKKKSLLITEITETRGKKNKCVRFIL